MNFIPYPRVDKNLHHDLESWRSNGTKAEGNWRSLKKYLADNCKVTKSHALTKCWYSELHQGDNYVLDVEHFRPKNKANPLKEKDVKIIEKILGFPLLQDEAQGHKYDWLEFDYRNYRIVTGFTNRGGAKHIYFPVFKGTRRLINNEKPWIEKEFPLFLDPVNRHDSSLLIVTPDGCILPKTAKQQLNQSDIDGLPHSWNNDAFDYTRAVVTIKMYRLDETIFNQARKEFYDYMTEELDILIMMINENVSKDLMKKSLEKISRSLLPSAQFSLASRCSLINYTPDSKYHIDVINIFNNARRQIFDSIENLINSFLIDWDKP
ncbi:hypothetical protein [Chryseobacterium phosphatilyticum]|nr:hypothetical protein [Chryseobacterium phosphatilyticum]